MVTHPSWGLDPYTRKNVVGALKTCEVMMQGARGEEDVAARCEEFVEKGLLPSIAAFSKDGW